MNNLNNRTHYPLSVDCVIFGYESNQLKTALIQRKQPPFQGNWALPGGFVIDDETVEEAAKRELYEETGLKDIYLEQYHVFSNPDRDPRGRVITVAFFALIRSEHIKLIASGDASLADWWVVDQLPSLAFDHLEIFSKGVNALRRSILEKPLIFYILPKEFTLTQLQMAYEQIFGKKLDKRNFRKKIQKKPYIEKIDKQLNEGKHRPAQLFVFNEKKYKHLKKEFLL